MKIPDKVPSKLTLDKIRSANAVTRFINKQVRKKYDDPKEVSKFGEISKARKAKEENYKKLMGGM